MTPRAAARLLCVALALGACGGGSEAPVVPAVPTGTPVLTSIALSIGAVHILKDHTTQLTATPRDQFGNPIAATVTYASSDASTALVSATGQVYGEGPGTASIIATAGNVTATIQVLVTLYEYPVTAIVEVGAQTFAPITIDVHVGGTVTWQFGDVFHTVNFDAITGAPQNVPASADIWVPRTFNTPGTFSYYCNIHVGMGGQVVVHIT